MQFLKDLFHVLRRAGGPAFVALVVSGMIDQSLNQQLEQLLMSDEGPGSSIWTLASASLLNSLIFPVFVSFCILYGIARLKSPKANLPDFLARTLNQLYIETLRTWGSVLRWGLLLIIPGIVRFVQLTYVPFIVAFHGPYDKGESDVLQTSRKYAGKHPFPLLGILLIFSLIAPLVMTDLLDEWRSYQVTPLAALGCTLLDLLTVTVGGLLMYRLFERTRKELGDESVFQLEGHPEPQQGTHL